MMKILLFLQREFVSYQQAIEYYGLGYKPIVRLSHKSGSVYKIGKKVLIRRSIFEEYLRDHVKRGLKNGKSYCGSKPERWSC